MASTLDKFRNALENQGMSYNELEDYMYNNGYFPVETEDDTTEDNIIRFTNYKRELWVYVTEDEDNDVYIEKITPVTKMNLNIVFVI